MAQERNELECYAMSPAGFDDGIYTPLHALLTANLELRGLPRNA